MHSSLRRGAARAAVVACALPIALATATPASAHIDGNAENAQAGTGPVTVAFHAESESSTAGIVGVATQLPVGIAPADVTLAGGPTGWALTPTTDGFQVAGPALEIGVDAEYTVSIAQLPTDMTQLAFPTLQRYSDGREDAWIEPITDAVPEPNAPAPVLDVAPSPAGAATTSTPTPSGSAATAAPSTHESQTDVTVRQPAEDASLGTPAIVVAIVAVLALAGGGVWFARRRRAGLGATALRPRGR